MDLTQTAREVHEWAKSKGFYDHLYIDPINKDLGQVENPSICGEKIALMHSELSEMLDALRDGDMDHEAEELADLVIRALDYAGFRGFDLEAQVLTKMAVNADRPRLHGRVF